MIGLKIWTNGSLAPKLGLLFQESSKNCQKRKEIKTMITIMIFRNLQH